MVCGAIYLSMWGSYLYFNAEVVHNGDKIKLRDAVGNFIKSPAVQEFTRNLKGLWQHLLHHGFWSTWSQLVESLDPFGEKNALRALGLEKGATQVFRFRSLHIVLNTDDIRMKSGRSTGS